MGVFSAKQGPNMDAKRNTFDLSFANNLTMQFGKIYPVFVKPCDPGDSFNIKASFGLNFLPTVYPVQTPMKAYLHFFYCRNRTVWDDFMNFYTMKDRAGQNIGSSELIPPYIDFFGRDLSPSSLFDYMGLPVSTSLDVALKTWSFNQSSMAYVGASNQYFYGGYSYSPADGIVNYRYQGSVKALNPPADAVFVPYYLTTLTATEPNNPPFFGKTIDELTAMFIEDSGIDGSLSTTIAWVGPSRTWLDEKQITAEEIVAANLDIKNSLEKTAVGSVVYIPLYSTANEYMGRIHITNFTEPVVYEWSWNDESGVPTSLYLTYRMKGVISFSPSTGSVTGTCGALGSPAFVIMDEQSRLSNYWNLMKKLLTYDSSSPAVLQNYTMMPLGSSVIRFAMTSLQYVTRPDSSELKSPYFDREKNPNGIRISSLPFRHYAAIYNYFYRDNRNNPLRDSAGNPVYNEILLNISGGRDDSNYSFYYHNWEQDFLTTCVQEPQLGVAPLVGISSLGEATFANEDGSTTKVQLTYAEDGDTVTGWESTDGIDAPVAQTLIQMASQGISITDFRNVNAFQTWLEVQMRKTLRFGDSIQGHFNVNPRYDDYLYPEFIGGVTQDVDTYQVNQTVPTDSSPLGSYAGQAICKGRVPRTISKFCDEPGYIIGLLSLVPRPVYSQVLPKHYLRHETLDYHYPEFNNISYQPVLYSEVSPWLSFNEDPDLLNQVFGYQRPWYDLISSIDEAHGQFLSTLNGFILRREFVSTPQLSSRFLTVHPEDLNDIFATQMSDSNDVVLGQLYFDVKKKTTISKFGIPSLQV
uniref:Major capsid protein n=1 Tax=Dulem virus 262 TaxID=3145739 RepID=A0AAU8AVS4_9VIRU